MEPPADEPAAEATDHRVTYDWAAPSRLVTIEHQAGAPTPYLVAIYAGDHSDDELPYQRLAFYFQEGLPEYNLQYVPSVVGEGTGEPISLAGNAFLRVGFVNAQAHDDAGESTVSITPDDSIGFRNLKSYGSAGDFEGHLTYGLGLQVAPNSDQVLLVRAGELTKSDGAGGRSTSSTSISRLVESTVGPRCAARNALRRAHVPVPLAGAVAPGRRDDMPRPAQGADRGHPCSATTPSPARPAR